MPEIVDKVKEFADNKLNKKAQPGNQVEGKADSAINDSRCLANVQGYDPQHQLTCLTQN